MTNESISTPSKNSPPMGGAGGGLYSPSITIESFLSYPEVSTGCDLCDAIAEILQDPKVKTEREIARLMKVDRRKLSDAIELHTSIDLSTLLLTVRIIRIRQFIQQHPDMNVEDVAHYFGFRSRRGLWLMLKNN